MKPMVCDSFAAKLKKILAVFVLCCFSSDFVFGAAAVAPILLSQFNAKNQKVITQSASLLGLTFSSEGAMIRIEKDQDTGKFSATPLTDKISAKMLRFLSQLPKENLELGMALALQSYLAPRMDPRMLDNNQFVTRDKEGRLVLTPLGRVALVDIIAATDGGLLEKIPKNIQKNVEVVVAGKDGRKGRDVSRVAGGLKAVKRRTQSLRDVDASAFFDGVHHELGDFDWKNVDDAVMATGGLQSFAQTAQEKGYSINKEKGTVRILIAATRTAKKDHFKVRDSESIKDAVYKETGLDGKLLDRYGAKIVRVIDNIVAVDIDIKTAAKLGLALQEGGIESRPARVYKAANQAMSAALKSPITNLLGQFLPIPTDTSGARRANFVIKPQLAESGVSVDVNGLRREGMTGRGAYVGIIDSGVDMNHADFRDANGHSRVRAYIDFTGEGYEDVVGHGTHVTGIIGGNGESSNGKFKGMAPDARFKVAKVFGTKGETDESVILAAMKWMKEGEKVDIINMSLGGPGAANKDPLSSMVNQMTVKDNILIVAAAGNEGPFEGSVGSPGNSRYALTVGGVDKNGKPVFFSSRGPIRDENGKLLYAKPDLVGVAGGVNFKAIEQQLLLASAGNGAMAKDEALRDAAPHSEGAGSLAGYKGTPVGELCVYSPGIAAPRSSNDPDTICTVKGFPDYRLMSGTSQAAPMTTGFAADVIGYARANGANVDAFEIKAVLMEAAVDLKQDKKFQGAGLINGTRVAQTVIDRVKRGIPIGNIAFGLAMRLTTPDLKSLENQNRYEMTAIGLLDKRTGHILNTEKKLKRALKEIRQTAPVLMVGREPRIFAV